MCWDDYGDWWPLRDEWRTARKEHRCAEGCRIAPGDRYHYVAGPFEGEFTYWRQCVACDRASRKLGHACRLYEEDSTDPPAGDLYVELREHVDDLVGVVPDDVLTGLRVELAALTERRA